MAATVATAPRRRWPRNAAASALFFSALVFAATFFVFLAAARGANAADADAAATQCKPSSLFSGMKLDPELSDFVSLLESVGYRNSLDDGQEGVGITVLAPTNAALRELLPGGNAAKGFNSSLDLFSSVPAAARATIGAHILRGAVGNPSSELSQGKWLRTLATAKRPGQPDRSLGVNVVGASPRASTFVLRGDGGTTAKASFDAADSSGGCGGGGGGDALIKLDGVMWPFKF